MKTGKQRYAEELRDPRWQAVRRKCLEISGRRCFQCGTTNEELHVHHKRYVRGRKAWEYSPWEELEVLCYFCHKAEHIEELE